MRIQIHERLLDDVVRTGSIADDRAGDRQQPTGMLADGLLEEQGCVSRGRQFASIVTMSCID
jgi:hypothetical protein